MTWLKWYVNNEIPVADKNLDILSQTLALAAQREHEYLKKTMHIRKYNEYLSLCYIRMT